MLIFTANATLSAGNRGLYTVRDGAYGVAQRGIYSEASKGTYSIVLSSSNYYSGTDSKDETLIENTRLMLKTLKTFLPL